MRISGLREFVEAPIRIAWTRVRTCRGWSSRMTVTGSRRLWISSMSFMPVHLLGIPPVMTRL